MADKPTKKQLAYREAQRLMWITAVSFAICMGLVPDAVRNALPMTEGRPWAIWVVVVAAFLTISQGFRCATALLKWHKL